MVSLAAASLPFLVRAAPCTCARLDTAKHTGFNRAVLGPLFALNCDSCVVYVVCYL